MLALAIVSINFALVFYSIGVWRQKFLKRIELINLVFFWSGLIFDTIGTKIMFNISSNKNTSIHGGIGILAILLMLFHSIWVTNVYLKKGWDLQKTFERFSIVVWSIWVGAYILGVMLNH